MIKIVLILVLFNVHKSLLQESEADDDIDAIKRDVDYSDQIKLVSRRWIGSLTKYKGSKKSSDYRKNETDSLIRNIKKAKKQLKDKAPKEFRTGDIRNLIGDGNHVILFDCEHPSFVDSRNKKSRIHSYKKELIKEIKSHNNCSQEDNLWHNSSSLTTYSTKTKLLTNLPFEQLTKYFLALNLCDDFMTYLKHPGYFVKNYKKPSICSKTDAINEEGLLAVPKQKEAKYWGNQYYPYRYYPTGGFGGCRGGG